MDSQLEPLSHVGDKPGHKAEIYLTALAAIPTLSKDDASFKSSHLKWLDRLLHESMGVAMKKQILDAWARSLSSLPTPDIIIRVAGSALQKFAAFREGDNELSTTQATLASTALNEVEPSVREKLASAYEATEHYSEAARVLEQIPLDAASNVEKARLYIRILRNYVEEEDRISAEAVLNRIKNLPSNAIDERTKEGKILRIHFDLSQARILDSKRKFIDASHEYLKVSLSPVVDEGDRLQSLSAAVICAILAPAGPARSTMLSRLYKDERATELTSIYGMLEKIFLDRILSPEEVKAFAAKLAPHQLAMTGDGSTVLDRAVIEHNLLAASRIYSNVHFNELGSGILNLKDDAKGTAGEKAEMYAARMLEQKRMTGCIDQIDGVIYFDTPKGQVLTQCDYTLKIRDTVIQNIAQDVEEVSATILEQYPVSMAAFNRRVDEVWRTPPLDKSLPTRRFYDIIVTK
ncbi:hypothetical protein KEM54_002252 [Ascosphaera aggregata]|nr:hypothetical protein KEM54_002252 [Ascosphaera aggregata]